MRLLVAIFLVIQRGLVSKRGASLVAQMVKNSPTNAGDARDVGSIPRLGRSPEEGNGNPLQYSYLENSMNRGVWRSIVHGVAKSQRWSSPLTAAHQAPLPMGFPRQEYWSGQSFPSSGDLPNLGIESGPPALQADSLPSEPNAWCTQRDAPTSLTHHLYAP